MNPYVIPGLKQKVNREERIDEAVCKAWGIPLEDLYKRTRRREIVEPRQVVMQYRRMILKESPAVIARHTGFDHASVNSSCKTVSNLLDTDRLFRAKYSEFLNNLI
ncbi:MAG: helix-turn-helix domain-containing protein [Mangrovibacterium sp.]